MAATHSSNAAKTELAYQGSSSAKWSLARPTKAADNRFRVSVGNGIVWGMGMVNVIGVFDAQASSDMDTCTLSAPTSSAEYPAVAPQPLMLALNKDPTRAGRRSCSPASTRLWATTTSAPAAAPG